MLRILFASAILILVALGNTSAQQRPDDLAERAAFAKRLRQSNPGISHSRYRQMMKAQFRDKRVKGGLYHSNGKKSWVTPANPANRKPAVKRSAGIAGKMTTTSVATFSTQAFNAVPDSLEFKALKALFLATGGENWINREHWPYQAWPSASTVTWSDFATWYGIDVESGDVKNIKLAANNLTGSLPPEIGLLLATDYLDLQDNSLAEISAGIGGMASMRIVYLTNNNLHSLPPEIGQLTGLEHLLLDNNQLNSLPAEIGSLSSLRYLMLQDNQLQQVPASIGGLSSLEDLYLDNNQLSEVPAEIGQLSNLIALSINGNGLVNLPAELGQLTNLSTLSLSNNALSDLPPQVGQLANLFSLSIDGNEFTELPAAVLNLANLAALRIDNNSISSLPANISQLSYLMDLYATGNRFTTFPEEVYGLPFLTVLDLSGNQIGALPSTIDTMQGLWDLFINDNQLTALPNEIVNMPLWSLRIGGNPIPEIPQQIYQMSATLLDLDISRMSLTSIPSALIESMNLDVLQVKGNNLDFGDLEPLFTAPGQPRFSYFDYVPQGDVGVDTTLSLPAGSSLDLNFPVGGQHNRYYWEKLDQSGNWIPFDSAGSTISKGFLGKMDEGLFRLKIINEWVHGLTIYSKPIPVEVFYQNHVRAETVFAEGIKDARQLDTLEVVYGEKATQWVYYDGLQRTVQAVSQQQSPGKYDGVTAMDYDALARQNVSFLPFTSYPADSAFYGGALAPGSMRPKALTHEQPYFYQNPPPTIAGEEKNPYAQAVFEDSPLGRPLKQGAPGETWNVHNGRTIDFGYETSGANEVLHWRMNPDGTLQVDSTYLAGELKKISVTDENGNATLSYVDKFGKAILQKTQVDETTSLSTYVIYDQFNNIRFRIPPKAVELIMQQSGYPKTLSAENIALYCFAYRYDNENRLVWTKAPGTEPVSRVYDKWGRLVLSQNGNQRINNQWSFTKFDTYNRPVISGFTTDNRSASEIQDLLQNLGEEQRYEHRDASGTHGYSNNTFPSVYSDVLSVTYYDDYSFLEDQLTDTTFKYKSIEGLPAQHHELVDGMTTASKVKVLGTQRYLWTVSYFDGEMRMVQSVKGNHLNGVDRTSVYYNFAGWITKTLITHFEGDAARAITIAERPDYDHVGRITASYHKINDQAEVQLAAMEYNELDEMIGKDLHVTDTGAFQSIDYRKNIRGWLNSINNAQLAVSENNDDEGDYFGMELDYNDAGSFAAAPQYNGMISSVRWSNALDTVAERGYSYTYDKVYRLSSATHHEKSASWQQVTGYSESQTYDANGNIKTLTRTDRQGNGLDVLEYTYNGNQLKSVVDAGDATKGFKDGNITGDDYAYDANGNLAKDRNLGIDTIYYDFGNHPDSLVFSNGARIKYVYDAAGSKLSQRIYNQTDLVNTRDYVGEFIYVDSVLEQVRHGEGQLTRSKIDAGQWVYEYNMVDYLGNVRVTFTTEPYTETFMATMETEEASGEEVQFLKVGDTRSATSRFIDHTKRSGAPKVTRLNGHHNIKEGPAKGLRVMPGDKVRMEVYVKYLDMRKTDASMTAATILSMLSSGGAARLPGDPGRVVAGASAGTDGALGFLGDHSDLEAPKAFLNYYLFDNGFNQVDAGFVRVSKSAAITTKNLGGAHEKLTLEVEIKQAGYLFTNLSQDGSENIDVYFDDFSVIHEHGYIVQAQDYYPYGLPFNTRISEHALLNRYLYQGKELQDSTGWYDFHARQYNSTLGRFLGVDPKDQFGSPFLAMGNNPVIGIDPDGKWIHIVIGAVVGGVFNLVTNLDNLKGDTFWEKFGSGASYFGVGAAAGAVGAGTGNFAAAGAIVGGGNAALNGGSFTDIVVGAGIGAVAGYAGGVVGGQVSGYLVSQGLQQGFVSGFVSGFAGGATGGFINGFGSTLYQTGDFGEALKAGGKGALYGGLFGGMASGVITGLGAAFPGKNSGQDPRNFWSGEKIAQGRGRFALNNSAKGSVSMGQPMMTQFGDNPNIKIDYDAVYQKMLEHSFAKGRLGNINGGDKYVATEGLWIIEQVRPMLLEGSNTIITNIGTQQVTIRVFVQNGTVISGNIFPGLSNRSLGTVINFKND